MNWVALKMLTGDRAKYLGIIFGVAFATLLMTQQISIFAGIMRRTASQILDVRDADIWVMDRKTRFIDEVPALPDGDLQRVRGVPGVEWAVKLFKGQVSAKLVEGRSSDGAGNGNFRSVVLFGIDDATMVGAPYELIMGSLDDLRQPGAVLIDKAGYEYMWPGEKYELGRTFEMNDTRAVLVGICKVSPPFTTLPVLYTRYSQAEQFVPHNRNFMSFVLAKSVPGENPEEVCQRIEARTDRLALTQDQFFWKTIHYFLGSTGIPVNFGITITLGFIIGVAIAGQTFYLFTIDNLKQFGSLKAMGVTNARIIGMILLQGLTVGLIGYGIGMGLAASFFEGTSHITHLAGLCIPVQVFLGVGGAVLLIVVLASLLSIRKVLILEPAIVFRG
ncbi:MAG: ABC transporter permease [Gemmataceae bacterium]|nr:ABC transporter permease [Gemmataceae bacterium]